MTMANLHWKDLSLRGRSIQEDCKFNIKGQKYLSTNQDSVTKECWGSFLLPGEPWLRNAFFPFFIKSWDQCFVPQLEKRMKTWASFVPRIAWFHCLHEYHLSIAKSSSRTELHSPGVITLLCGVLSHLGVEFKEIRKTMKKRASCMLFTHFFF